MSYSELCDSVNNIMLDLRIAQVNENGSRRSREVTVMIGRIATILSKL